MMKPISQWTKNDFIDFVKNVDRKTWIKFGIGMLGLVAVCIFFVEPAWFARPKLRQEIETMSNQMRLFHTLNQKRVEWQEDEKVYTKLIEDAKERIYKEDEVGLLLGQVSRIATEARADVIASRPKAETVEFPEPYDAQYEAISYDFTMQGGYHAFGEEAEGIETYPKLLRIQSIHIVPLKDESNRLIAKIGVTAIAEKNAAA